LSSATTTGMSAPPIGRTNESPSMTASAIIAKNTIVLAGA
jgi:hypothetical protein